MTKLRIIDSHTGGEPTRIVISGGPNLGDGSMSDRLRVFRSDFDRYRSAIVNEPRGSDAMVGALLCEPQNPTCTAGVIFFNNVGFLGMCVHGTVGLVETLSYLERIRPGQHRFETPVGEITCALRVDGTVAVTNVHSHRAAESVALQTPSLGKVMGDVAYGGNWFFLVNHEHPEINLTELDKLTDLAWGLRQAINASGFPQVDHVELVQPFPRCSHEPVRRESLDQPTVPKQKPVSGRGSRHFVLCPGKAYDRSPCGTGASAHLACLAADGELKENEPYTFESIIGSRFTGTFRWVDRPRGIIEPEITGRAYITAEGALIINKEDPYSWGIQPEVEYHTQGTGP